MKIKKIPREIFGSLGEFSHQPSKPLMLAQFPIFQAFAGDAGVVPENASDATYTYYVHGDHLGSAHLLTEGQSAGGKHVGLFYNKGDLIQRIEYNPYGQETYVLNPNLSFDPSFTGQTYDIESGLYYFNARYYNPQLGRFIQADTVVPSATDFQSYNRYAYARNNPLKYVDPSGHSFWSVLKNLFAGFVSGFLQAFLTPVLGPIIAGMVGGFVGGLITGGIQGALIGAAAGGLFGALLKGLSATQLGKTLTNAWNGLSKGTQTLIKVGTYVAGASLSYAVGGMNGLAFFSGACLGAYVGGKVPIGERASSELAGNGNSDEMTGLSSENTGTDNQLDLSSVENGSNVSEQAYNESLEWVGTKDYSNNCNRWVSRIYGDAGYSIDPVGFANDFEMNPHFQVTTNPIRGDIIQFDKGIGQIPHGHVAIFAGNGQMISTSSGAINIFLTDPKKFGINGDVIIRYLHYIP